MLLAYAFSEYLANFKTALVFVLLLVFAPIAFFLGNAFVGSGTIFLDYSLSLASPAQLVMALIFAVFYILLYSFFVSIIIFSVRKDLSTLHFHYYLTDMIKKFALKIFWFNLIFFLVLFLVGCALFLLHVPIAITAIILFLIAVPFLFVPQSIVIDEENLVYSVYNGLDFFSKHFSSFAYAFVTAIVLVAIVQLLEFGLDSFTTIGPYVTLVISLVFIVPYLEVLKTYLYMLRYDLIKTPELLHRKIKKKKKAVRA